MAVERELQRRTTEMTTRNPSLASRQLGLISTFVITLLLQDSRAQATGSLIDEIESADSVHPDHTFTREQIAQMNLPTAMLTPKTVPHRRLADSLLRSYDARVRPVRRYLDPVKVHIEMSLYQIIQVNEPEQNIKMNIWMIESWTDELLGWNPEDYDNISSIILPHGSLWLPDTYLYNSVVMAHDETERYMNIKITTNYPGNGSSMSFLYPAIYTITCRLNVRYFPYDLQNCTLIIGSWTHDATAIDYDANPLVNMAPFIENEEWEVEGFTTVRRENLYACCPNPWVIVYGHLVIRRKPLYYLVNLIIPTSIITLVSITGFFTPASTDDDRTEKINLGITTLLAMSILMLMVSDQMPTTSEFVPLIAWFFLSIIVIVSIGTFLTTVVLSIHARRGSGILPPDSVRIWMFRHVASWVYCHVPPPLSRVWAENEDDPRDRTVREEKSVSRDSSYGAMREDEITKSNLASPKDTQKQTELSNPILAKLTAKRSQLASPNTNDAPKPNTNSNFLQVSAAKDANEGKLTIPLGDISNPTSPRSPSTPLTPRFPQSGMWGNALTLAGINNVNNVSVTAEQPKEDVISSSKVPEMRRRRQCSLEWEFLATILDRVFLIVFSLAVLLVTAALMVIGKLAH